MVKPLNTQPHAGDAEPKETDPFQIVVDSMRAFINVWPATGTVRIDGSTTLAPLALHSTVAIPTQPKSQDGARPVLPAAAVDGDPLPGPDRLLHGPEGHVPGARLG